MDYVAVFKTADYVDDGVYLADVGKELVAQALALGCAFYQTCNVYKFNDGRSDFLRIVQSGKLF